MKKQWNDYSDIMNSAEVQEVLGVSKETFLKIIHQPGFPKMRPPGGRKYLYPKSALQEYFYKQATGITMIK